MAKKRNSRKCTKCPEPINTLLNIAGATTLRAYVKHKIKKDYAKCQGEESVAAAATVFTAGAMRRGGAGIINLGGLMGLNSALKDIKESEHAAEPPIERPFAEHVTGLLINETVHTVPKYTWRQYCEDGLPYNLSPYDFETADEYDEALQAAKQSQSDCPTTFDSPVTSNEPSDKSAKKQNHLWRKYCTDGALYSLNPEDFETADDYADAIAVAIKSGDSQSGKN